MLIKWKKKKLDLFAWPHGLPISLVASGLALHFSSAVGAAVQNVHWKMEMYVKCLHNRGHAHAYFIPKKKCIDWSMAVRIGIGFVHFNCARCVHPFRLFPIIFFDFRREAVSTRSNCQAKKKGIRRTRWMYLVRKIGAFVLFAFMYLNMCFPPIAHKYSNAANANRTFLHMAHRKIKETSKIETHRRERKAPEKTTRTELRPSLTPAQTVLTIMWPKRSYVCLRSFFLSCRPKKVLWVCFFFFQYFMHCKIRHVSIVGLALNSLHLFPALWFRLRRFNRTTFDWFHMSNA